MPDSQVRFMSVSRPSIPPSFTLKKNAILASLSTPESTYTDLSPKGSIDEAIKSLIDRINALEGIVTTSSCSGRVSVFLEGNKKSAFPSDRVEQADDAGGGAQPTKDQVAVPGGKGMGGRWLFVSHQPVHFHTSGASLTRTLGMERLPEGYTIQSNIDITKVRLARFQFEPMV